MNSELTMVHLFKLNGSYIAVDANSGSIHEVDDVAYDIIEMFSGNTEEDIVEAMLKKYPDREDVTDRDIRDCIADVRELKKQGKLFSEDEFSPLAAEFKRRSGGVVKALCLHVAHACNLTCSYCFAGQGKFKGEAALMPFDTGRRALDFLIENSGTRHNLEVDFFGGEPLLNFDVCRRLVE